MAEQGCMYHIWTPERQVQLFPGKEPNYRRFFIAFGRLHGGVEFANSVDARVAGMNENFDASFAEQR